MYKLLLYICEIRQTLYAYKLLRMCSLVMSLFSHDFTKMKIDYLKYQLYFSLGIQYLHSAWFLDVRTSILVNFPQSFGKLSYYNIMCEICIELFHIQN